MRKSWTRKEDEELLKLIALYTRREISIRMGFSLSAVKQAAHRLNASFSKKERYHFLPEEQELIRELVENKISFKDIGLRLGRSTESINQFCAKRKIKSLLQPRPWTQDEITIIKHQKKSSPDVSAFQLSKLINRSPSVISTKLIELGLQSELSKTLRSSKSLKYAGKFRCRFCKEIFPDEKKVKNRNYCEPCQTTHLKDKYARYKAGITLETLLIKRLNAARFRAKQKKIDFNLDLLFLQALHGRQKGLCAYSKQPMSITFNKTDSISIDRIDSSLGYTKDNVCLARAIVNSMKGDLSVRAFHAICEMIVVNKEQC